MRVTYLPHEAAAEVSNQEEGVEFNWSESHLVSDSSDLNFN